MFTLLRPGSWLRFLAVALWPALDSSSTEARLGPPSSLKPVDASVVVFVNHRHRVVQECHVQQPQLVCRGREVEGDTATTVSFEATGVVNAALDPGRAGVSVSFPHHTGPQEQTVKLKPGDWQIDWPGAPTLGLLHVTAGARPSVTLVTASGRCRQREDRCELDDTRSQRIQSRDDR